MVAKNSLSRVEVAVSFLEQYCRKNGVIFYQRPPSLETPIDIIIVGTDGGEYGSVGINMADDTLKCYCRNNKQFRWAQLEGFEEEDIYELFADTLVKEVSLEEMASIFVRGASSQ